MNRAVRMLEKAERRRIEATWQNGQQWRGLASDDFTRMVDALVALTDGSPKTGFQMAAALRHGAGLRFRCAAPR